MIGPAISEISSTNEVKKPDTSVQVERLALCPAHSGRRSDRPAASAGIARLLTSLRCNGYGRIAVPSWFSSCNKRLLIPRASLPVKPFVRAVCPAFFPRSLAMKEAGAGLLARQEYRSHLHALCAKSQGRNYAAHISYSARRDHGHVDVVDDLRDERQRARE